jgi:hypothetical protein
MNTSPSESQIPAQPEVGTLWRDREGNTWRLVEYIDGGSWCRLRGVIRFDGVPWSGATWHADWLIDLVKKAVQIDG